MPSLTTEQQLAEVAIFRPAKLARTMPEAKAYARLVKISSIVSLQQLECLGIRECRALAAKMNAQMGLVISKARFGKTLSLMRKPEIINAIIEVRAVQLACPRGCQWRHTQLSTRLWEGVPVTDDAKPWIHYVAYDNEQLAFKFHQQMQCTGKVQLAALRRGTERTNSAPWEVKCWGLDPAVVQTILERDTPLAQPTSPAPKPKPRPVIVAPQPIQVVAPQTVTPEQIQVWQQSVNTLLRCHSTVGLQRLITIMFERGYELSPTNKVVPVSSVEVEPELEPCYF